ncbi:MAG: ATP-binding protein, partial [Planctomycetes bacterium]|nr:ATP-binding protein [Planctomycetota bacterium]
RFYLAGGFASHLDLDSARRIGLIPDLPDEKITRIGNAAIEGATLALLSTRRRLELEETVSRIEHIELETDPDFFDHFVEGCQFKPIGAGESAA